MGMQVHLMELVCEPDGVVLVSLEVIHGMVPC